MYMCDGAMGMGFALIWIGLDGWVVGGVIRDGMERYVRKRE